MSSFVIAAVVLGLLGLIVGSFLAAVTVRLPADEDVVMGRSHCMSCDKPLAPWHLVPVVSWLALRGRCGWCGAPISPRYILIETAAAALGVWAAWQGFGSGFEQGIGHDLFSGELIQAWFLAGTTALLGWQLLLIGLVDAENFWLPDVLTWPLIGTGLAATAALARGLPLNQIVGVVLGFAVLWGLAWIYKRVRGRDGLGGGDPFLFAGAGAWVGWIGLPSVLLWACAAGFSVVLVHLMFRRHVSGADRLPFGTFLVVGVWLTWLYGPIGT
ncbi:MAG: prepilin peptidase [Cypionkella sp.]